MGLTISYSEYAVNITLSKKNTHYRDFLTLDYPLFDTKRGQQMVLTYRSTYWTLIDRLVDY